MDGNSKILPSGNPKAGNLHWKIERKEETEDISIVASP